MDEIVERFKSVHLRNERTIWIRPARAPLAAGNLTVFLDGEFYRDRVGAVSVMEGLEGSIGDSWYVFVSMESVEARWLECPCHPPFAQFIAEEMLRWLESRFEGIAAVRRRTLVGLSYTGLAAAFIAKEYSGIFNRVICQSGSFWWKNCWLTEQYRLSPSVVASEFYLDVGTKEVAENVQHREEVLQVVSQIEGVRRFRDVLLHAGYAVKYVEFDGGHDFESWKKTLPEALKWALPDRKKSTGSHTATVLISSES
ncbi:MAG TPA: alpha/beta hydrolase-fold protein [Lacunisphaera sp.]|jgi:enterochelin esterase family protein